MKYTAAIIAAIMLFPTLASADELPGKDEMNDPDKMEALMEVCECFSDAYNYAQEGMITYYDTDLEYKGDACHLIIMAKGTTEYNVIISIKGTQKSVSGDVSTIEDECPATTIARLAYKLLGELDAL